MIASGGQPEADRPVSAAWSGLGSFWSDAYGPHPIEIRAREPGVTLIQLENGLLERVVRLQAVEAQLWRIVLRRQRAAGRRAVRQIERERQRLGRDLHTGVGQLLTAIRIQLEVIAGHLPAPAPPVRQALDRIGSLATDALDQVRAVSHRLHAPEWQRLLLADALRQLWDTSGVAQRFASSIQTGPIANEPDPMVKTLLYRAAQEALSNIIRHAKATRVDLALSATEGEIRLSIQDDGVGFDTGHVLAGRPSLTAGLGLRSIREQAADLGGKLLVRSGPLGTTLVISVPLET